MFELGLITTLLSKVLSPLLARSGTAIERRVFKDEKGLANGGSTEERKLAYDALRHGFVELRTMLEVIWALESAALPAAIVAIPMLYSLTQRLPDVAVELNDAFLGVTSVGRREAVEAAIQVATELRAITDYHSRGRSGRRARRGSAGEWQGFDTALSQFVAVARNDLGIQPLNLVAAESPSA